jgi:hypothetical protein
LRGAAASRFGFVASLFGGQVMELRTPPVLTWDPKRGYRCSACHWKIEGHIQQQIPSECDPLSQMVREKFTAHIREKHPDNSSAAQE